MSKHNGIRRSFIRGVGGVGASIFLSFRNGTAAANNSVCAPGEIQRLKVWNDFIFLEGSVNIGNAAGKGGGAGKVPKQVIRWEVTCESPPPPPPPVPKPAPKSGHYIDSLYLIQDSWFDEYLFGFRAKDLYFNVGVPSFARIYSNVANLRMETLLTNGTLATLNTSLTLDGGGFRLTTPSSVDNFAAETRAAAVAGTWSISDIVLDASVVGSENFGVGAHYAGRPLYGSTGHAFSQFTRPGPPIYTDPFRSHIRK